VKVQGKTLAAGMDRSCPRERAVPFPKLSSRADSVMVATLLAWSNTGICMASVAPIHFAGTDTLSLRQLDELNGLPKGASFRWFKACEAELVEGRDYFHLPADAHQAFIDELRVAGQIYTSTRHLLLLTRSGYEQLRARSAT